MIDPHWLAMVIGIVAALLLIGLLLKAALGRGRPKGKMRQLAAAYRRFSPSGAPPGRDRRLRLKLMVLVVLVILNVVVLGVLAVPSGG